MSVVLLLLIVAVILLALAAFNVPCPINLGWLGMALFVLTFIIK